MKRIYVGNLSFSWGEEEVRGLFSEYGEVYKVDLINDRATGRPRGFGFVEMDADSADAAIDALNGQEHGGRVLRINEAYAKGRGGDGPDRDSSGPPPAAEPAASDAGSDDDDAGGGDDGGGDDDAGGDDGGGDDDAGGDDGGGDEQG